MSTNSKLYIVDTVKYPDCNGFLGPYHRCQVINGNDTESQYAEFTESQLQIAIKRAKKHRSTQCLYGGNQTENVADSKQNIFSKFFSNLFK